MRSSLSATHLLRHLVLFCLVCLFILTVLRCSYVLWQYPKIVETNALVRVFATGLRFDLALIGMLVLPVLLFGSTLGLFKSTRKIAKIVVLCLLMIGLVFVLSSELITPYFLAKQGVRPDWLALQSVGHPINTFTGLWSLYFVPITIALAIVALVLIAYAQRLEWKSLLRRRLHPLSTSVLMIVGTGLCLLAIYSDTDFSRSPLSLSAGLISSDVMVNEIALNSGIKLLYSIFM